MAQKFNHPFGSIKKEKPGAVAEAPQEEGQESPEQVAEQHGPAQEVHLTHEHEMGAHHVHSVHPDGYEHHSDHGSAEEAHDHAKKLAGHEHSEEAIDGLKKFAEEEGEEGGY